MEINWKEKLSVFKNNNEIFELIHKMGNLNSARSTVYQLSKKYPEFLWSYENDVVKVRIPEAETLEDLAKSKWEKGCKERNRKDFLYSSNEFEGEVYQECLEELADLFNYVQVAYENNRITQKDLNKIKQETHMLYNVIRRAFEINYQELLP